jgi:hypothetical protein
MAIEEARIEHMIDVAADLIGLLVDRGFDSKERRAILSMAAIEQAKTLGRSKAEIVGSLTRLYNLCRGEALSIH